MRFIAINRSGNNTIILRPKVSRAHIEFNYGENRLRGVPKNYHEYFIHFSYFAPSVENVNSILLWRQAKSLKIVDRHNIAGSLIKHIDAFSKLKELKLLELSINFYTYDKVDVAVLVHKLSALREMVFTSERMTEEQMQEFKARNVLPGNWRLIMFGQSFYYYKDSL